MSWLHYLIEANIYLGVFYLCYCLFLGNDTHYTLGRVYLIFSCVVAFILPLTQVSILKPAVPQIEIVQLPVRLKTIHANVAQVQIAKPANQFSFDDALIYLYITGAVIALLVLIFRLRKLYILTRNKHSLYQDQYKLINLEDEHTAFSFFNYLFIGKNIAQAETIIAHELVHIRQKHSVDIIFMEAVKVVNWFNPFIYLMQRSLKTVHEYIADEQTAAYEQDALTYSSFLLNNAYGIQGTSIAHSFFNYNLLKKRIIMLNKNRSGKLARLKYLAVLPLCGGMLCASTLVFSKDYGVIDLLPTKTTLSEINPDTAFAARPPAVFGKNYILQENGYLINKKTEYFTVTITDKAGNKKIYNSTDATAADRKILMEKYNYRFFNYDLKGFIKKTSVTNEAFSTNPELPPPPPPTSINPGFEQLAGYISQKVKYPANAIGKRLSAALTANFKLDANGRINNVSVSGNANHSFIDALKQGIAAFPYPIKSKPGNYKIGVTFTVLGDKIPAINNDDENSAEYVGATGVLGLTDAQRKKLMPPPPPPAPPVQKRMPPPPPPAPKKVAKVPEIEIEPLKAAEPKARNKPTKTPQSDAVVKQTAMNELMDRTLSVKRTVFPFDKNYQLKKGDRC